MLNGIFIDMEQVGMPGLNMVKLSGVFSFVCFAHPIYRWIIYYKIIYSI